VRTKTQNTYRTLRFLDHTFYYDNQPQADWAQYNPYLADREVLVRSEIMTDEKPRFKRSGNCLHEKSVVTVNELTVDDQYGGAHHVYRNGLLFCLLTDGGFCNAPLSIPADIRWDELNSIAVQTMMPTLDSGFSAATFLHELKDLKRLPEFWNEKKSALKNFASDHLNTQFGWIPFMSDVVTLCTGLKEGLSAIRDFQARAGKRQKRHFRHFIDVPSPSPVTTYNGNPQKVIQYDSYEVHQYSATMVYTYTVPDMSDIVLALLGLIDRYSGLLNPTTLWDAIPFSFVVDWFFDVGAWLRQFRIELIEPRVVIHDFCHSAKLVLIRKVEYTYSGGTVEVASFRRELYARRRDLPILYHGLHLSNRFGPLQASLAAALTIVGGKGL